jgi:5-methylcytosine-specific restriction endonuclease McrA
VTAPRRPYSRVYWSIVDDPDFDGIYGDNSALATWLRLLIVADGTWPATAPLPRSVREAPLRKLVNKGLIALLPGDRYRVKGLDAERERRSSSASASATLRWQTPRREGGKPASRGTRFKVLERDNFTCRYCGGKSPDVVLDVDHIVPVRDGGTDDLDNLVSACVDCNTGKSGHPLRADTTTDARASGHRVLDETRLDKPSIPGTFGGNGVHDGRHGDQCSVCFPPSEQKVRVVK